LAAKRERGAKQSRARKADRDYINRFFHPSTDRKLSRKEFYLPKRARRVRFETGEESRQLKNKIFPLV